MLLMDAYIVIVKIHSISLFEIDIIFVNNSFNFPEEENFVERVQTTFQGNIIFFL